MILLALSAVEGVVDPVVDPEQAKRVEGELTESTEMLRLVLSVVEGPLLVLSLSKGDNGDGLLAVDPSPSAVAPRSGDRPKTATSQIAQTGISIALTRGQGIVAPERLRVTASLPGEGHMENINRSRTTGRSYIKMRLLPTLLAGLLAVPGLLVQAADAPKADSQLAYTINIDPAGRKVHIAATVSGHSRKQVTRFTSFGLRKKVKIGVKTAGALVTFSYQVPIDQAAFNDPFQPVLNKDYFAGFMGTLLLAPRIEGVNFKNIPLTVETPKGWKIATSRGVGAARYMLSGLKDLVGTLVCAGDYSAYSFDLQHKGGKASTKCHVAIRGKRDWADKEFVDEFKRLVRGQMNYFGGGHPAPVQFLTLHLLPKGGKSRIPAFNRRAPGHDTVLALQAKPRKHFEFLGMLAHEHLHNWYPYTMKSDLGPWFMEGLNDYVAYRGLLAGGLHTREQFTGMLSKWHREYLYCIKRNDRRLMPYRRGMIAAWVFDIELRRATEGRRGLADVLGNLIDSKPEGGVVRRSHFVAMLKEVSGRDMATLYKHLVERDGAVDLSKFLKGTGFRIVPKTKNIAIRLDTDEEKKLFESILSQR